MSEKELIFEINDLYDKMRELLKQRDKACLDYLKLVARIDKAIKYINDNKFKDTSIFIGNYNELLEILKGE